MFKILKKVLFATFSIDFERIKTKVITLLVESMDLIIEEEYRNGERNSRIRFRYKISKDKPPQTHLSFPTDIDFREVKHEPMVSPTKTCTDSLSCVFIIVREIVLRKSIILWIEVDYFRSNLMKLRKLKN